MYSSLVLALFWCPQSPDNDAVDAAIRKEMQEQKLVGVAIGIIRDGQLAYLKAYGHADAEKQSPMTTETVINWASNSKPLAAVLAMQLVEKGKLDLDADVRTYVPEFPEKKYTITMRQLLCHQSGIPHYTNGKIIGTERKYQQPDPFNDPVNALDKFNRSELIFEPCTKSSYSSYSYVLASAVIQRAAGRPFMEQTAVAVTIPLKMASFQWDSAKPQPNWAKGYIRRGESIVPAPEEANDWKHGAGGFKSNIRDFARWAQALINRELVSEATENAMWTRQKLKDGKVTNYGLGFVVSTSGGLRIAHSGSQSETKTNMVLYPREKRGIVIMSNSSYADVSKLTNAVQSAIR